jgi:hypothetical protein
VAWFPADPEPTAVSAPIRKDDGPVLKSVVKQGTTACAVIDGKVLRPGVPATFEGWDHRKHTYELVRAWAEKGGMAVVKVDDQEYELSVRKSEADAREETPGTDR